MKIYYNKETGDVISVRNDEFLPKVDCEYDVIEENDLDFTKHYSVDLESKKLIAADPEAIIVEQEEEE